MRTAACVADVAQQFKYTEPTVCPTPNCSNRVAWNLNLGGSAPCVSTQSTPCEYTECAV